MQQVSVDVVRPAGGQAGVLLALFQPAHVEPVRLHVHIDLGQRLVHLVRRGFGRFSSRELTRHYTAHQRGPRRAGGGGHLQRADVLAVVLDVGESRQVVLHAEEIQKGVV